jgi:uroporphyrinogen III methyltransferase/synthase
MGAKALPRIVEKLTEAGLSPDTPAATVQWASTARQKTATGTLATIVQKVKEAGIGAPAISIIGRVVTMRPVLNWFESRPLFGKTVVVTRTRQQASDLTVLLEEQGAQVIEAPTIDIGPPGDWKDVDAALRQITSFDWLLFTSPSGVKHAHQRMRDIGLDGRSLGKVKIGVVGESTAKSVSELFFRTADAAPDSPSGEGLARHLHSMGAVEGRRFLSLRADIARPTLVEKLTQYGCAELKDVSVYETRPADALPEELLTALKAKTVDWITFTSSSTATNFIKLLGEDQRDLLDGVGLASIGPQTTQTVIELGLKVTAEAKDASLQALVDCLH